MRIGQENDPRRFRRARGDDAEITKDIPWRCRDKFPTCEICGITLDDKMAGYRVRGSKSGKYVCFRCDNESEE